MFVNEGDGDDARLCKVKGDARTGGFDFAQTPIEFMTDSRSSRSIR
jgi:hypothetical protein